MEELKCTTQINRYSTAPPKSVLRLTPDMCHQDISRYWNAMAWAMSPFNVNLSRKENQELSLDFWKPIKSYEKCLNTNSTSTTAFVFEVSEQVFTWCPQKIFKVLLYIAPEVTGKIPARAHSAYKVTHQHVCVYIAWKESGELSCHWDIKYRTDIFLNAHLLPVVIPSLVLEVPTEIFLISSWKVLLKSGTGCPGQQRSPL